MNSMLAPIGPGTMLVAAIGCAMLALGDSGLTPGVIGMMVALMLLAAAVSYWERRAMRAALALGAATAPYTASLHAVSAASMGRWSKHIDIARGQTEEAGLALTRDFFAIRAQLRDMLASAAGAAQEGVVGVLSDAQRELEAMMAQLNQALEDQKPMLRQVEGLVKVTDDLKQMAASVGEIARQTNLLAINAAIEAARAGESGRGFAVVAAEVRRLSAESGALGKQIQDNVQAVNVAMAKTLGAARQLSSQNATLTLASEETIRAVLERFGGVAHGLSESSEHMSEVGRQVRDKVSEVVVQLQFQDRTSQILVAVGADIERLTEGMRAAQGRLARGEPLESFDVPAWVAQLEKTYTTVEQFDVPRPAPESAPASTEMTFF
jgi:methyl-accepting chemotaxis protein